MNKKGIDFTPSFAFGLLLGIAMLIVGISFLWAIFQKVQMSNQNSFGELVEKISNLKSGEDVFLRYKLVDRKLDSKSSIRSVIGFDKGQDNFVVRLDRGTYIFGDLAFEIVGNEININYKRPAECNIDHACICSCIKDCTEEVSCFSFKDIEKIDGKSYFEDIGFLESIQIDSDPTFVIPPPEFIKVDKRDESILLRIKRERKTIFINS